MVASCKDLKIGDRVLFRGDMTSGFGTVQSIGEPYALVRSDSTGATGWWTPDRLTLIGSLEERAAGQPEVAGPHVYTFRSPEVAGPHEYRFRSPFILGDRVRTTRYMVRDGEVVDLDFRVLHDGKVERKARVRCGDGCDFFENVETLSLVQQEPTALEFRLKDRVTRRDQLGGPVGVIHSLYLNNNEAPYASVLWEPGDSGFQGFPLTDLRHAL